MTYTSSIPVSHFPPGILFSRTMYSAYTTKPKPNYPSTAQFRKPKCYYRSLSDYPLPYLMTGPLIAPCHSIGCRRPPLNKGVRLHHLPCMRGRPGRWRRRPSPWVRPTSPRAWRPPGGRPGSGLGRYRRPGIGRRRPARDQLMVSESDVNTGVRF